MSQVSWAATPSPALVGNPKTETGIGASDNIRFGSKADVTLLNCDVRFTPESAATVADRAAVKGHVWTAPSWQGLSSRTQHWSVQPCVRPVDAVHMTAGHNALRGSGPGQKLAFDNALAQMGCPDRRIDRLCITCCSPSQPSHHTGCPMRSRSRRERSGFFVAFAPSHHRPRHPGDLVGERDGRDLRWSPRQQRGEPRPMPGAMDFGIADHG